MKILVTGNAGSGKTTVARWLAEREGLPVFHLDSIVWKADWVKTPQAERVERELELAEQPHWVIDGVSSRLEKAADLVIFLDVPKVVCLWRVLRRSLRYLFRSRPELPEGCPEWKILFRTLRIIGHFHLKVRPTILERMRPGRDLRICYPAQPDQALEDCGA